MVHWSIYSIDGEGYLLLDLFATMIQNAGQVVMISVFLMLMNGGGIRS